MTTKDNEAVDLVVPSLLSPSNIIVDAMVEILVIQGFSWTKT